MKPVLFPLQTIMQTSEELPFAECFTLTTVNQQPFFFTNMDIPVQIGTNYFYANSVRVEGLRFKLEVGMSVDEQEIAAYANLTDTVNSIPFMTALRTGVFDGGFIKRERAFFDPATWPPAPGVAPTAIGSVTLFYGRISKIPEIGRTAARIQVKSLPVLLDAGMPRNCFQASCSLTLYDAACGIVASSFTSSGTIGAGSTPTQVNWAGAGTQFTHGTLSVTNGVDIYDQVTVSGANPGVSLFLARPFRFMPAVGDTFNVNQGCDHTMNDCNVKFLNLKNFRGFPYVPPAEAALGGA